MWRGSDNALSLTPSVAIDNLEVIRGPMSTLYGADTMGGVINVITRKHNGVAEGAMSVEGQYNQGDNGGNGQVYGLYFSTPVSDSISYTVYGNYLDVNESLYSWQPGFTKHRAQENYNLVNNFDLSIHDQHDLGLEIQLSREDQFGASMFRGRAFEQERQLQKYMLNYEYSSYFMLLDANFYYSNFDVTYDVSTSDITEQNFGGDLQASFFVGDHSITVGAEARQADINNIGITRGSTGRATTAAYMETNLELSEPTTLTLGGRFDQDSLFGSEFTYRGYITQGLNDLLNLKAGVGTAFKAPSIAQVLQTYTAPASGPVCPVSPAICNVYGNPELKAETGTFSELGVYYANGLTFANATLFSNRVEDIIHKVERTNSSGGYYTFSNVDKAELRGLELNVEHQYEQVNMDVSYTYLDAIDTHREATGGYISS